jgi:hypothetical protein
MRVLVAERQTTLGIASLAKVKSVPYSAVSQRAFLSASRKLQAKNQIYDK